jgi:hypothetical protein
MATVIILIAPTIERIITATDIITHIDVIIDLIVIIIITTTGKDRISSMSPESARLIQVTQLVFKANCCHN